MALTTETKSETVAKTATKHKAVSAPVEPKREKTSKKDKTPEKFTNVVPTHLRGVIKGTLPKLPARKGGDITNAEYAKANGITPRQASKIRSGKKLPQ